MPSLPCGISNWRVGQAYRKYGIRQARLVLIQRWCTRCSRHYKLTKPHKNKRMKRVIILYNNQLVETTYFELKSMPVKRGSLYHDEPADIQIGARLLCCLWNEEKSAVLKMLAWIEGCLSGLSHIRVRLFSKDAWDAERDMNLSAWASQGFGSNAENKIWCFMQAISENVGIFDKSTNVA